MKDNKKIIIVLSAIIVVLLISLFFILSKDKGENGKRVENVKGNEVNSSEFIEDEEEDESKYQNIQDRDYTEQDELVLDLMIALTNYDKELMLSILDEKAKEEFLSEVEHKKMWNKGEPYYKNEFENKAYRYILERYDEGDVIYYRYDWMGLESPNLKYKSGLTGRYGHVTIRNENGEWRISKEGVLPRDGSDDSSVFDRSLDSKVDVIYNEELYQYAPNNQNN